MTDARADAKLPAQGENATSARVTPFRSGRVGRSTLVAAPPLFGALSDRLQRFGTLHAWGEQHPQPQALQGRGVVYVAALPECETTVAVRHAWHGGLLAPLTGDRFLVPTRAPREAAVSVVLQARGVPTPPVVAYALYPAGPGFRRVDVASKFIPKAADFGAVLQGLAPMIAVSEATPKVVSLLHQLAAAQAVHPDLNVKNILLSRAGTDAKTGSSVVDAWVLDVDVVRFRELPPAAVMVLNLRRLVRSIRKWHARHDLPLDEAWLREFQEATLQPAA